jgi:hypothetical protein
VYGYGVYGIEITEYVSVDLISGILAFRSRQGCKHDMVVSFPAATLKQDCADSFKEDKESNTKLISKNFFIAISMVNNEP